MQFYCNLSAFWLWNKSIKDVLIWLGLMVFALLSSFHSSLIRFKLIESTKQCFFFNKEFDQIHFLLSVLQFVSKNNQLIYFDFVDFNEILFSLFISTTLKWNSVKVMCCVQCDSVKIIVLPFCSPSGGYCFPPSFVGVVPQATLGWWCLTLRLSGFLPKSFFCILSNKHWSYINIYTHVCMGAQRRFPEWFFITAQYLLQFIFIFFKWINWNCRSIVFDFLQLNANNLFVSLM